jgi:hypothetical protein
MAGSPSRDWECTRPGISKTTIDPDDPRDTRQRILCIEAKDSDEDGAERRRRRRRANRVVEQAGAQSVPSPDHAIECSFEDGVATLDGAGLGDESLVLVLDLHRESI